MEIVDMGDFTELIGDFYEHIGDLDLEVASG